MRAAVACFGILLGIGFGGTALAAPQILGLTASSGPVPLVCGDDSCTALAGTFCLQQERALPVWGTPYIASHPERLTLAFLGRDGRVVGSPGGAWVRFTAYNGYSMVRMSISRSLLAHHGATAVALEIGPGISLLPVPRADDTDPQSADEIALATGPMRVAAAPYLDAPSANIEAARLVATLVGALPERRAIRDDHYDLWRSAIPAKLIESAEPSALSSAHSAYDRCRGQPEIRHCLMSRHRELMERDNARYWEELAGY